MSYQRHQLSRAKTDEEYEEMLFEIHHNERIDRMLESREDEDDE